MRLIKDTIPEGDLVEDNVVFVDGDVTYIAYNGYVFVGFDGKTYLRANNDCRIVAGDEVVEVERGEYRVGV